MRGDGIPPSCVAPMWWPFDGDVNRPLFVVGCLLRASIDDVAFVRDPAHGFTDRESSELDDAESRDELKVTDVGGTHSIPEFESADPDQQIRERNADTPRLESARRSVPPGAQWDCHWLDGDTRQQFVEESLPAAAAFGCVGAGDAVGEFEDGHDRNRDLFIAALERDGFEQLRAVFPWRSAATAAVESRISPKPAPPAAPCGRL